jgi:hypothetical protein
MEKQKRQRNGEIKKRGKRERVSQTLARMRKKRRGRPSS